MERESFRSITIRHPITDRRGIHRPLQDTPDPIHSAGHARCVSKTRADAINREWQDKFPTPTLANSAAAILVRAR